MLLARLATETKDKGILGILGKMAGAAKELGLAETAVNDVVGKK